MTQGSFSSRVWQGDPTTVGGAKCNYLNNKTAENLLQYAMVLYSLRHKRNFTSQLITLCDPLIQYGKKWEVEPDAPLYERREMLDQADCLATYLYWLSTRPELNQDSRDEAHMVAVEVCDLALAIPGGDTHTELLLHLTAAQLKMEIYPDMAFQHHAVVPACISAVKDPSQRARVLRKYGMVAGQYSWGVGKLAILQSALVPGIHLMTRTKSLAALVGIQR